MSKTGFLRNWGCVVLAGSVVLVSLLMGITSFTQVQTWGFIVAGLGIVLTWMNREMLYRIVASYLWWDTARGTVVRSDILTGEEGFEAWKTWIKEMSDEEWHDWVDEQADQRSATEGYFVQLEYQYMADGETFHSHRYSTYEMPPKFDTRQQAEELVEQYPDGSPVQVHYNPDDPGEAFLNPVGSSMEKGAIGVASALVLVGSWMLMGAPGKFWILGLLLAITVCVTVGMFLREQLRDDPRQRVVQATVQDTKVEEDTVGSGEAVRVVYQPWMLYEFEVHDNTYTGTEIDISGINRNHPNHSEAFIEQYPEGSTIQIHYDPDNPDNCIFRPDAVPEDPGADGSLIGTVFNVLFGVLALGIVSTFVWVLLRNKLGYDLPPLSLELIKSWIGSLF